MHRLGVGDPIDRASPDIAGGNRRGRSEGVADQVSVSRASIVELLPQHRELTLHSGPLTRLTPVPSRLPVGDLPPQRLRWCVIAVMTPRRANS